MNSETRTYPAQPYLMVAARVLMAAIFFLSGLSKLGAIEPTRAYMVSMHVSGVLVWPTLLFEIGSAILLIVGYQIRVFAVLLAAFCMVTALIFHSQFGDQIQMIMFLKNVSMAGGFILLACVGAGSLSFDARAARR